MLMTDFLHKVDQLAVSMNKDQLIGFIHNEARILNENDRREFLTRLSEFADSAKKPSRHLIYPRYMKNLNLSKTVKQF